MKGIDMADLSKKYQEILEDLGNEIKSPKELEFVKGKISELTLLFMDSIDKILSIENKQTKLDKKVKKMRKDLDQIEEDMYIDCDDDEDEDEDEPCSCPHDQMHDNEYEFEIVCPYCDYDFLADNSYKDESEIECPKCHNVIELDWENTGCTGSCDSCGSKCYNDNNNKTVETPAVAEDDQQYNTNQSINSQESTNGNSNKLKSNQNQGKKNASDIQKDANLQQDNRKKDNNEDDM